MKIKKKSAAAVLAAALLVTGVTAVFATSKAPEAQSIDDLPQAVMTNTDPNSTSVQEPGSTPADKSISGNRIHPVAGQPAETDNQEPAFVETDPQNTDNRIHPVTGEPVEPVVTVPDPEEPAESVPENRWGVPDGEIPWLTQFTASSHEDAQDLYQYLLDTHGITFRDLGTCVNKDGSITVEIHYTEREARNRLANGYPVNAKGETYGNSFDRYIMGYLPDLIGVRATNGNDGYILKADYDMFNPIEWAEQHGGDPANYEEWVKILDQCKEWKKTQPYIVPVPVYDADRNNVVGYFNLYNSDSSDYNPSQEDIELELKTVADFLRRDMDLSEEEIAKELEALKAVRGWN